MKAVNKGSPAMAVSQKTQQLQMDAVKRVTDPAGEAERQRQRQDEGTVLGGRTERL